VLATGTKQPWRSGPRIVLIVFVALALLLALLRMAEFAGHRIRHRAPRAFPAAMSSTQAAACRFSFCCAPQRMAKMRRARSLSPRHGLLEVQP